MGMMDIGVDNENAQLKMAKETIYDLLCERFSKEAINSVVVKSDRDSDGDRVLRIIVVLEVNHRKLIDGRKMVGLVRHIRTKLDETQSIDDFPMISFVSKKEAGKLLEAS